MSLLVDQYGKPMTSAPPATDDEVLLPELCPRCAEGPEKREVREFLGGHWRVLCSCGHEFLRGKGLAPLMGDLG